MIQFRRRAPEPPPTPQHRIVTTREHGATRHFCLDCTATRSGIHPPPPPCKGRAA